MNRYLLVAVLACALFAPSLLHAEEVRVRHTEGLVHGFLVLRTMEGKTLAEGDLTETAVGETVTNHLVFHFKDGSVHDETAAFSQRRSFRLLKYHLVQKGPAFRHPVDVSIDTSKGEVTVRYGDDDGKEKVTTDHLGLPVDVANGMVLTLLKNIPPGRPADKSVDGRCHPETPSRETRNYSRRRRGILNRSIAPQGHAL
jgi:hypothetical protein